MDAAPSEHDEQAIIEEPAGLFASRRGRILRENLTAYLFLLPSALIIFIFGLFPVGFALYVSLYKWRLIQGGFRGLDNYTKAIDTLAYVFGFWLAVGTFVLAISQLRRLVRAAHEHKENPALWLLPGAMITAGLLLFVRFVVLWLPEVLGIAQKMIGQERTDDLITRLLGETFLVPTVAEAIWLAVIVLALGIGLAYMLYREMPSRHAANYLLKCMVMVGAVTAGVLLFHFTLSQVQTAYTEALEEGTDLDLWVQIVTISAGVVLLGLAWWVWKRAAGQQSNFRTFLTLAAGALLMAGGWMLIGELPRIIAEGDKDLFQGFLVTVYYSAFTVPVQLTIALFLAYLLFQNIKGQSFFRMVYFLPYVTPAVASAAVFRILFTNRPTGAANQALRLLGAGEQKWIQEPAGVFQLLAEGAGASLPEWAAGPSLALMVIILFNIWTFVGYNTVVFLAGLGAIPHEMYEAAEVDGAGRWALFRHITLPLLSPTTFFLSLIAIIGTFKAFNHIWVLRDTGALGTTDTASVVIFLEFFKNSRLGYASAMAFVLFGVILSLTLIQNRIAERSVFYG